MIVEAHAQMSVADVMTPMVFEVDASATVSAIAESMVRGRVHRVFVVEHGKVVGVVSALDLLQLLVDR
jgi:CBS domain-containing protein